MGTASVGNSKFIQLIFLLFYTRKSATIFASVARTFAFVQINPSSQQRCCDMKKTGRVSKHISLHFACKVKIA